MDKKAGNFNGFPIFVGFFIILIIIGIVFVVVQNINECKELGLPTLCDSIEKLEYYCEKDCNSFGKEFFKAENEKLCSDNNCWCYSNGGTEQIW